MSAVFQRLVRDDRGSANLWVAFCILVFFMLAALLYNVHILYAKYYAVQDEVTRCASITLDSNIHNAKLRDVITDVEYQPVSDALAENLRAHGWTRDGEGWAKYDKGALSCCLTGLSASVTGPNLRLTASVQIPLPWKLAGRLTVSFPLTLYAKILYIN